MTSRVAQPSSTPTAQAVQPERSPQMEHAPHAPHTGEQYGCTVQRLRIKVEDATDGSVTGFLHLPTSYRPAEHNKTAAILLSGAGGGVTGPSAMYLSMGDKLASLPSHQAMLVLRLDYRYPARNKYCVPDVLAAMDYLQRTFQIQRVVLVGWSFGGAPAFTVGGMDDRVAGVATVASQTAETEGIAKMSPNKPVLLLHGTGDRTLSPQCSKRLQDMYGSGRDCTLKLFAGDDHGLTQNAEEAEEVLCRFILRCGGVRDDGLAPTIESHMMAESKEEKLDLMRKGGDLRGEERI